MFLQGMLVFLHHAKVALHTGGGCAADAHGDEVHGQVFHPDVA